MGFYLELNRPGEDPEALAIPNGDIQKTFISIAALPPSKGAGRLAPDNSAVIMTASGFTKRVIKTDANLTQEGQLRFSSSGWFSDVVVEKESISHDLVVFVERAVENDSTTLEAGRLHYKEEPKE